jgi:transcription elongation factor/antiterminator RfaH
VVGIVVLKTNLDLREGQRWYAVHSLPHKETSAQLQLQNQKFQTFLPRIRKTRRHARKLDTVLASFFPRYLFIILDMERDRWRSVNGTIGVSRLVMQNDRPQALKKGIVENLIACINDDGLLSFDKEGRLKIGQKVELLGGPFVKQLGIIERLDSDERVRLLLDFMGQKVRVSVSSRDVMPAA